MTEDDLLSRITALSQRACDFKTNEKRLFQSGLLFELYGGFLSIWRECETIVWDRDLDDRTRMLLMDIQEDVYTHFLLSSLGYLPLHVAEQGDRDQERVLEMARSMVRAGGRYPHLCPTVETYRQLVGDVYAIAFVVEEEEDAVPA